MAIFTDEERARVAQIWDRYQRDHDLSSRKGKIAGIDPQTGRVWIGDWMTDVVRLRDADGIDNLLFFERIGYPTALRKGRGRKGRLEPTR